MKDVISGSTPFKVNGTTFTVGKSANGYTLAYGVSKDELTPYTEPTPANEALVVNGCTPYTWFALSGNTGEVTIIK